MKKFFWIISIVCIGTSALANTPQPLDDAFFQEILSKYKLTKAHLLKSSDYRTLPAHLKEKVVESSYCYRNDAGEVIGNHVHELRDIASTTKLFSSFFTISNYGTEYQFNTFFYVITSKVPQANGSSKIKKYLYIQGDGDPTFSYDRFKSIYLNRLKDYGRFDEIHFDSNFYAYVYGLNKAGYPSSHTDPGTDRLIQTKTAIKSIFATKMIEQTTQTVEDWMNQKNTEAEIVDSEVASIQETSEPVGKILKSMNDASDNYSSSVLFDSIPNKTSILMDNGFTEEELEKEIRIFNGSGYPIHAGSSKRIDNKASCGAMLKLLDTISDCVGSECKLGTVFSQGCDKGLCTRFKDDPLVKQNVVAKTGLTNYVISLVGWLDPVHRVPFAFLITTLTLDQRYRAKQAIDEMVATIYKNTFSYPMINETESPTEILNLTPLMPENLERE